MPVEPCTHVECCPTTSFSKSTGVAGGSAAIEGEKTLRSRPEWFFAEERVSAGAWFFGSLGEQVVGARLDQLPPGWFVTHDVLLRVGNLDHVVVGPPGIFVVNSKYHGDRPVSVDNEVYVGARRVGHVAQGRRESSLVTARLTRAGGVPALAVSLIAIVSSTFMQVRQPHGDRVRVVHVRHVSRALETLPSQLAPCVVHAWTEVVRDPSTWR